MGREKTPKQNSYLFSEKLLLIKGKEGNWKLECGGGGGSVNGEGEEGGFKLKWKLMVGFDNSLRCIPHKAKCWQIYD